MTQGPLPAPTALHLLTPPLACDVIKLALVSHPFQFPICRCSGTKRSQRCHRLQQRSFLNAISSATPPLPNSLASHQHSVASLWPQNRKPQTKNATSRQTDNQHLNDDTMGLQPPSSRIQLQSAAPDSDCGSGSNLAGSATPETIPPKAALVRLNYISIALCNRSLVAGFQTVANLSPSPSCLTTCPAPSLFNRPRPNIDLVVDIAYSSVLSSS